VKRAARHFGAEAAEYSYGFCEFIPDQPAGATDREQREHARRVYQAVIEEAASAGWFPGRDVAKIWQDICLQWRRDRPPQLEQRRVSDPEESYPPSDFRKKRDRVRFTTSKRLRPPAGFRDVTSEASGEMFIGAEAFRRMKTRERDNG
jgi:hypothetical protein